MCRSSFHSQHLHYSPLTPRTKQYAIFRPWAPFVQIKLDIAYDFFQFPNPLIEVWEFLTVFCSAAFRKRFTECTYATQSHVAYR